MKISVKNIASVQSAEIELDGITLLAGYNNSGKSTVSKSLYGIISAYSGLTNRVNISRLSSVQNAISSFLRQAEVDYFFFDEQTEESVRLVSKKIARREIPVPQELDHLIAILPEAMGKELNKDIAREQFEQFAARLTEAIERPDIRYVEYIVGESLRRVFDSQINTLDQKTTGEITLNSSGSETWVKVERNKIIECSGDPIKESRPIYIEPLHVLDGLQNRIGRRYRPGVPSPIQSLMQESSDQKDATEITIEEHEKREDLLSKIDMVIHGGLVSSKADDGMLYRDANYTEMISLRNVASGNKTFAVIKRLVENGMLQSNGMLIIDEPETNLHPAWQLKLAEVLALLNCQLGIRMFLNTHSPYFTRAIEVYSAEHLIEDRCHYYKTYSVEENPALFATADVTGKTELIYHDLYIPFEEL